MKHVDALTPIRKDRFPAEGRITRYCPKTHPGIIRRMMLCGYGAPEVATVIGVTQHTLREWRDEHPDVQKAFRASLEFNSRLAEAAFNMAVSYDEENDEYIGKNASMLKFLLQSRLGWKEQGLPDDKALPAPAREQLQQEQLESLISKVKGLTTDESVIEGTAEREET